MPSVPLSKESPVNGPVCPHAAKIHSHPNGEAKPSFPVKGVDKTLQDTEEANGSIQINTKSVDVERKWIRPDLASRCTWSLGASTADSPHTHVPK